MDSRVKRFRIERDKLKRMSIHYLVWMRLWDVDKPWTKIVFKKGCGRYSSKLLREVFKFFCVRGANNWCYCFKHLERDLFESMLHLWYWGYVDIAKNQSFRLLYWLRQLGFNFVADIGEVCDLIILCLDLFR